jgi:hypothetical protein
MTEPDKPKAKPNEVEKKPHSAKVVQLRRSFPPAEQPDQLSAADALKIIRMLAADTGKIVLIPYGKKRANERRVTRRQIELCVQKGTISEGPFINGHGNWQVNLWRHAAGEQITCVVAIDWVTHVLVINTF